MRGTRPRALLLVLPLALAVRDFAVRDQLGNQETPDGFDDFFTHFHVTPQTHRAILPEHGDAGVTLSVAFALHPVATVLGITLPPGYVLTEDNINAPAAGCPQIFAPKSDREKSSFEMESKAKLLTEHILSCEVTDGLDADTGDSDVQQKDAVVQLTLQLKPDVPNLSAKDESTNEENEESEESEKKNNAKTKAENAKSEKATSETPKTGGIIDLQWWYFHIRVLYPDRSPEVEENRFIFHWASEKQTQWEGETWIQAWPILGDWGCVYSDWEGWGACSTKCGGGQRMLVRKPLLQPPNGMECTETVHPEPQTCNEHPCLHHCKYKEEKITGACSADCGGGVRFTRKRFFIDGDNFHLCPQFGDQYSEQLEACNTQPCKARCELSTKWEPVTPCDAVCGKGHFKVMKKVLQKEEDDLTCIPEYKWLPCERQKCTEFTVSRTSPSLVPTPQDRVDLVLSWSQKTLARKITVRAPMGYTFGEKSEDACKIKFHSLQPHMESCKVADQLNSVELFFATPLPPALTGGAQAGAAKGRYEMGIEVQTPKCEPMERWVADPIRHKIICNEHPDRTRWEIQFLASEADAGAEIRDAMGFLMEWRETSGIQLPKKLKLKAEQILLDEAAPTSTTESTTTEPKPPDMKTHAAGGNVLCMGDRDPGYCQDRSGQANVICSWQGVCQVSAE